MNTLHIEQQADKIFENYSFAVTLHYMSGWHLSHNKLSRDIHVGVDNSDKFIAAQFIINLTDDLEIHSYGAQHSTIHIGEFIKP